MHRSRLSQWVITCESSDVEWAAMFWAGALGSAVVDAPGPTLRRLGMPDWQPGIVVEAVRHAGRVHPDIETDAVEAEVTRLEKLHAVRVAQIEGRWILAAPTGQRFSVSAQASPGFADNSNQWP